MQFHYVTRYIISRIQVCFVAPTLGEYTVEVRTHSFSNPGSLLANGECCDYNITAGDGSCAVPGCDFYFYYCLRSIDSTEGGCSGGRVSMVQYNDHPIDLSLPMVLGLPNPLPLPGRTREWNVRICGNVFNFVSYMVITCM